MNSKYSRKIIRFQKTYFGLALLFLGIEILIASCFSDYFIRPVLGDFLVVILIYCLLHSFLDVPYLALAVGVLAFAFAVEGLQYIDLIGQLGWSEHAAAHLTIGSTFDWRDLAAYSLGIVTVVIIEKRLGKK